MWQVLVEDVEDDGDYDDPSESFDFCFDCGAYFGHSEETGHAYCDCGFWCNG